MFNRLYFQLQHQYRIVDEQGPSHEKTYMIVLELGDEQYAGQCKTIKGAQQKAAAEALKATNYKQPLHRTSRNNLNRPPREKYGMESNCCRPHRASDDSG